MILAWKETHISKKHHGEPRNKLIDVYGHQIFDKGAKYTHKGEKTASAINDVRKTGYSNEKE